MLRSQPNSADSMGNNHTAQCKRPQALDPYYYDENKITANNNSENEPSETVMPSETAQMLFPNYNTNNSPIETPKVGDNRNFTLKSGIDTNTGKGNTAKYTQVIENPPGKSHNNHDTLTTDCVNKTSRKPSSAATTNGQPQNHKAHVSHKPVMDLNELLKDPARVQRMMDCGELCLQVRCSNGSIDTVRSVHNFVPGRRNRPCRALVTCLGTPDIQQYIKIDDISVV